HQLLHSFPTRRSSDLLLEHHRPRRVDLAAALARDEGVRPAVQRGGRRSAEPGSRHLPRLGMDAGGRRPRGPLRPQERHLPRHRRGPRAAPADQRARPTPDRRPPPAAAPLAAAPLPAPRLHEPPALLRLRDLPERARRRPALPRWRRHPPASRGLLGNGAHPARALRKARAVGLRHARHPAWQHLGPVHAARLVLGQAARQPRARPRAAAAHRGVPRPRELGAVSRLGRGDVRRRRRARVPAAVEGLPALLLAGGRAREELLVQRGLELGLARQDARVRRDLTAAVIDAVVTEHEDGTPSDPDLEAFYQRERDFFARPGRLRVRQLWCRADTAADAPSAEARVRAAAASLRAGADFAGVRARLGDPEIAPLPDALLSPAKLLDHLGPTAPRAALELEAGAVSDPVRSATGYHVLQVVEREAEWVPPREEIADEVLAEYRRRRGERALRAYV